MTENPQKFSIASQLHNFTKTKTADSHQNIGKRLPCHVTTVNNDDTVEVAFDITDPVFTLPNTTYPQAFSKYSREPTQVGDPGYIVSGDVDLSKSSGIGGGATAKLFQRGNLTPGVFHPISNTKFPARDQNQFLVTGGPTGHKIQSQDGTTFKIIDALNNILHTSALNMAHTALTNMVHTVTNGILSHVSPQIQQIASTALTIANTGSNPINFVAKQFNVGAPSSTYKLEIDPYDSFTPPTPPQPNAQTIFNVIGSILASSISASGSINAGGGFGGAPGGGNAAPGNSGEVISSVSGSVNLASGTPTNITSITLTAGDWDVHGEVWYIPSATLNCVASALSNQSATFPPNPAVGTSRTQLTVAGLSNLTTTTLATCRANLTTTTIYYLVGYAAIASGTCTAQGKIWARRV